MIAPPNCKDLAASFDIPFVGIGKSCVEIHQEDNRMRKVMQTDAAAAWCRLGAPYKESSKLGKITQEIKDHRPDLIIGGKMTAWDFLYAMLPTRVPFFIVSCQASVFSSKRRPASGFITKLRRRFSKNVMALPVKKAIRVLKNELGEDFDSQINIKELFEIPRAVIVSPIVTDAVFAEDDIYGNAEMVGNPIISQNKQLKSKEGFGDDKTREAIKKFFDEGDCIYIGWGSMVIDTPAIMTERAVRAARKANQRAIILGGYAQLSMEALVEAATDKDGSIADQSLIDYARENILFVKEAPHEWIFPQVTAIVHHGGAGTLHTAMRSGRPMIVTPVWFDQYDHAFAVNTLGIGIGFDENKRLPDMTWEELGDAIETVVTSVDMAKRAKQVSEQMQNEDGAKGAADAMEKYWKDFVVTGELERRITTIIKSPLFLLRRFIVMVIWMAILSMLVQRFFVVVAAANLN